MSNTTSLGAPAMGPLLRTPVTATLLRILDTAARISLELRRTAHIPCRVPCDGCGRRPADTTRGALARGERALCECCEGADMDPFNDGPVATALPWHLDFEPEMHTPEVDCGCDRCLAAFESQSPCFGDLDATTELELNERADERRAGDIEAMDADLESPWCRCPACQGTGNVPDRHGPNAHNPTGLTGCDICEGTGEVERTLRPALEPHVEYDPSALVVIYAEAV